MKICVKRDRLSAKHLESKLKDKSWIEAMAVATVRRVKTIPTLMIGAHKIFCVEYWPLVSAAPS